MKRLLPSKSLYIDAKMRCGHVGKVHNSPRGMESAAAYDCQDCRRQLREKNEKLYGHQHLCSACSGSTILTSGCHCDQQDIYLLCDDCKERDRATRIKLGLVSSMEVLK